MSSTRPSYRYLGLRTRIVLLVFATALIYLIFGAVLQQQIFLPSYLELEQAQTTKDLDRVHAAVASEANHIERLNKDWAYWDDSYRFAFDQNSDYITSNLTDSTLTENNLDFILYLNVDGSIVHTKALAAVPTIQADSPLIHDTTSRSPVTGFITGPSGPLLVASSPILSSDLDGPARGSLIMARHFDTNQLERLEEQTQTTLEMWSPSVDPLPDKVKTYLAQIRINDTNPLIEIIDEDLLSAYTHVNTLNGTPALILRATFPRAIAKQGQTALTVAMASTLGFSLFLILLLYFILQRQIGLPVKRLTDHLVTIRHSDELVPYSGRLPADEIGTLGEELSVLINQLNKQLSERERLEEAQTATINQLITSMAEIKTLRGIIPICASCKKIRDDEGAWSQVESYVRDHSEAEFSHGVCPDCLQSLYGKHAE